MIIKESISIPIKKNKGCEDLGLPSYQTYGSSGMDLLAAVEKEIFLTPGERALINTGISIELPHGYEAQIRPRSGLATNSGITVLNTPGTIDSDYRGEIKVLLINLGGKRFRISRGMRIAQIVFATIDHICWDERKKLQETSRGKDGFGSTGQDSSSNKS